MEPSGRDHRHHGSEHAAVAKTAEHRRLRGATRSADTSTECETDRDGGGVEKVLRLYREKYFDLNVKHFVEKLQREEQISLSYTWVKTALQNAGLGSSDTGSGERTAKSVHAGR